MKSISIEKMESINGGLTFLDGFECGLGIGIAIATGWSGLGLFAAVIGCKDALGG